MEGWIRGGTKGNEERWRRGEKGRECGLKSTYSGSSPKTSACVRQVTCTNVSAIASPTSRRWAFERMMSVPTEGEDEGGV